MFVKKIDENTFQNRGEFPPYTAYSKVVFLEGKVTYSDRSGTSKEYSNEELAALIFEDQNKLEI